MPSSPSSVRESLVCLLPGRQRSNCSTVVDLAPACGLSLLSTSPASHSRPAEAIVHLAGKPRTAAGSDVDRNPAPPAASIISGRCFMMPWFGTGKRGGCGLRGRDGMGNDEVCLAWAVWAVLSGASGLNTALLDLHRLFYSSSILSREPFDFQQ